MTQQGRFIYCPYCATLLEMRVVFRQTRPVCPDCGFVQFPDPKVAVIAFATWRDRLLLVRRGIEPMLGKWALPGGYMDAGEWPENALARELAEEVGLEVQPQHLLDVFPMLDGDGTNRGIVLVYAVEMDAPEEPGLVCADDACEAAWFTADTLPADLAFESSRSLVAQWQAAQENF